jgi:diadenosine tetraphosphatase ApaH/serine/threonine PP2A family protein phosphatase
MKIAILSCIHSNLAALQAVGRELDAEKPDRVFCLGDVINYGAQPRECIAFVRERKWPTLLGNHEAAVLDPSIAEEFTPVARAGIYFTLGALSKSDKEWLRTLPESLDESEFQLVHGSPGGASLCRQYILTVEAAQAAFAAAHKPWVFVGHTHVPLAYFKTEPVSYSNDSRWKLDRATPAILNAGSVGQPRDKDPRACYLIFDTETLDVYVRRVAYDVERTVASILEAGLPERVANRLKTGV